MICDGDCEKTCSGRQICPFFFDDEDYTFDDPDYVKPIYEDE